MILYNVTIKINNDVHHDWLDWMKSVHIPDVMSTGLFVEHKVLRVMNLDHEGDGFTYAIQYFCKNIGDYNEYQEKHSEELQKEHTEKFKDKFVAYRTIMKVVE